MRGAALRSEARDAAAAVFGGWDVVRVAGVVRASWTFDTLVKGQVTSSSRFEGGAEFVSAVTGYDASYRPLGQLVTVPASEGVLAGSYETSLTYTPGGVLESMTLPAVGGLGEETVTTYYDDRSMPEVVTGGVDWGVYVASTRFDVYGEMLAAYLGNDRLGDGLVKVDHRFAPGTRRLDRTVASRPDGFVMDLRYTYDEAGNPTRVGDEVDGRTECYAYDGYRRLTDAWTPADGNCATAPGQAVLGGPAGYWTAEQLDEIGNRTGQDRTTVGGDGAVATTSTTFTYPKSGDARPHAPLSVSATRTTGGTTPSGPTTDAGTFSYDEAGNTTTDPDLFGVTRSLSWDAEGHLAQVTSAAGTSSFTYTADGDRLVRRDPTSTTVYLPGGQELTTTADGEVKATRYYTAGGTTVAVRTETSDPEAFPFGQVDVVVADPHGTGQLSVNTHTGVMVRRHSDPYGAVLGATGDWPTDRGFLNKPVDATGYTHIGARYYNPAYGRFLSVDPVMDLTDPAQWHAYAYANNNPITYSDPTGLAPEWTTQYYNPVVKPTTQYYNPIPVTTRSRPGPGGIFSNMNPTAMVRPVQAASEAEIAEFRASRGPHDWSAFGHLLLDIVGMVPGAGEPADAINALWYAAEGDGVNAGASAVGIIPFAGLLGPLFKGIRRATDAAGGGRGLNDLGGIVSQEGTNAAGGRVFTSTGTITQNDFAGIVNSGLMRGEDVHILTGAHGTPAGSLIADASLFADDVARFGDLPGVTVHNLPAMAPAEVSGVLRSPGTIIGGFCDSAACLAPFK